MNVSRKASLLGASFLVSASLCHAGPLAENHVSIDLTRLSRDSNASVVYVYEEIGPALDPFVPLSATDSFDDDADTGYSISGSYSLNNRWSFNASLLQSEMDVSETFVDSAGNLTVFTPQNTNEFDAAQFVQGSYTSELSGFDLNAIYRLNEHVDFLAGLGILGLDERFEIISDDNGFAGVGRYTIQIKNDMQGLHVGVALNYMPLDKLNLYFVGKLGRYDNDSEQRQQAVDSGLPVSPRINSASGSTDATITDLRVGVNYLFTEQLALDFGYRLISVTDIALAESQFDTSSAGPADIVDDDDIDWDGYSLGLRYAF